jgi:hypothetical protein
MPSSAAHEVSLTNLLANIRKDYPEFSFVEGSHFSWQAEHQRISFKQTAEISHRTIWALLHELGHALLAHNDYRYDIELLKLEAAAWAEACNIAEKYAFTMDEDYIQDCLDTYRDWLHLRATCPICFARSLQMSPRQYRCFNCQAEWTVTRSRFCRPYRLQKAR